VLRNVTLVPIINYVEAVAGATKKCLLIRMQNLTKTYTTIIFVNLIKYFLSTVSINFRRLPSLSVHDKVY